MGCYKKGGRWYIDYYMNSKRKREVVTIEGREPSTITLREAEKALSIRKAEIAQGKFDIARTEKPVRFEKLVEAYLKWANENLKAPIAAETSCKNLLAYLGEGKNIYSLNLWEVEKYKSERKKQGRKPETINRELGVLRRMFNLAVGGALSVKVGRNPVQGLKLVKVSKRKHRTYKGWEFQALYEAAPDHFKPILLCAYMTGMRRSEIAKIKWNDVDFEEGYIHVVETKNNETRTIPIGEPLFGLLRSLKGKSNNNEEFVFATPHGKPYTSKTAWKTVWRNTLKKAGIEKGRFHDFRHTFCSGLIVDAKEDYVTVMGLSGHKDVRMLLRYSHTQEEAKKAAIQKLGENLVENGLYDTISATMDTYPDTKPENALNEENSVIALTNRND